MYLLYDSTYIQKQVKLISNVGSQDNSWGRWGWLLKSACETSSNVVSEYGHWLYNSLQRSPSSLIMIALLWMYATFHKVYLKITGKRGGGEHQWWSRSWKMLQREEAPVMEPKRKSEPERLPQLLVQAVKETCRDPLIPIVLVTTVVNYCHSRKFY